jgi:hypothetical protein
VQGYGQKVETLEMQGEMVNMFGAGYTQILKGTCNDLCPGGVVNCPAGQENTAACVCDKSDFEAWEQCQGSTKTKCVNNQVVPAAASPAQWKSSICPKGQLPNEANNCVLTPYYDPKDDAWRNMYSSGNCETDNGVRSTPVRFDVKVLKVTPHTQAQATYLKQKCASATFTPQQVTDLSGYTVAQCEYLGTKGLLAKTPVADCPSGKCLFSKMYKHDQNFLYISRPKKSFATMMRSSLDSDSVLKLIDVADCNSCARMAPTLCVAFVTMVSMIYSLLW